MVFPLYEWPDAVDYGELIDHVEKKYNIKTRDYGKRYHKECSDFRNTLLTNWLKENGYENKAYVLNKPVGSNEDWPKDSPEMLLRIEINSNTSKGALEKLVDDKFPYLDYWHQHCDEVNRGGVSYLWLSEEGKPEWVNEINRLIKKEVEGCSAYDAEEEVLTIHVDW